MSFPTVDRYADIIKAIVSGSYYENLGTVLPYRSGNTSFRLETGTASVQYGVYINEVFAGSVTTDASGNVVLTQHLPLGEVEVTLLSGSTGQSFVAYVTVRDYAIWLAAYADVLEDIDENIIQVRDNAAISSAEMESLTSVYGDPVSTYADVGQGLDAYRWQIHELRQAYRDSGGRFRGLEDAVGSFTQTAPFGYSRRKWGPNWVLDQSMLVNHRFLNRAHQVSFSGGSITGVTLNRAEPDVVSNPGTPHSVYWDATARTLTWRPNGVTGPAVNVADGELFLPGPPSVDKAFLLGRDASVTVYTIGATNNTIYLNIDDLGIAAIPIATGLPNPTPLQIAGDINTYLSITDPRYGLPYGAVASTYNGKLLIESPTTPGSVIITPGPNTAGPEVFGVKPGEIKFDPNALTGVTIYSILGVYSDLTSVASLSHTYDDTLTPPHY
ncbi:hypothetical protein N8Z24_00515, partial [bacterium]|nr:hypothetical protein [bacterium]